MARFLALNRQMTIKLYFFNTHKINISLRSQHAMSLIRIEIENTVAKLFVKEDKLLIKSSANRRF